MLYLGVARAKKSFKIATSKPLITTYFYKQASSSLPPQSPIIPYTPHPHIYTISTHSHHPPQIFPINYIYTSLYINPNPFQYIPIIPNNTQLYPKNHYTILTQLIQLYTQFKPQLPKLSHNSIHIIHNKPHTNHITNN